MIKRIEKCSVCGCEFSYSQEDVKITPPCMELERYITCPKCHACCNL